MNYFMILELSSITQGLPVSMERLDSIAEPNRLLFLLTYSLCKSQIGERRLYSEVSQRQSVH